MSKHFLRRHGFLPILEFDRSDIIVLDKGEEPEEVIYNNLAPLQHCDEKYLYRLGILKDDEFIELKKKYSILAKKLYRLQSKINKLNEKGLQIAEKYSAKPEIQKMRMQKIKNNEKK